MRPWEAEDLEWDEANEDELWDHRIRQWEVDDVFWNRPVWAPNKRGRSGDYLMVGETDGGRKLTIVVQVKPVTKQLRPITGWGSTQGDLSRYGRRRR